MFIYLRNSSFGVTYPEKYQAYRNTHKRASTRTLRAIDKNEKTGKEPMTHLINRTDVSAMKHYRGTEQTSRHKNRFMKLGAPVRKRPSDVLINDDDNNASSTSDNNSENKKPHRDEKATQNVAVSSC